MRALQRSLLIAFMAILLGAFPLLLPFSDPDEKLENRRLHAFPPLSAGSLLDREFYRQVGDYLRDHLFLRQEMTGLNARLDLHLFGDSPSPEVRLGKNGWLYYDRAMKLPCADYGPLDRLWDNVVALGDRVRARGRVFRLAVAPHKPTIYPDHLTAEDRVFYRCAEARLADLRAISRGRPVEGYVDLWDEMAAQRDLSPGPIYLPRDSHWNDRGAAVFARGLIDSLDPALWRDDDLKQSAVRPYNDDLVRLMGLPDETDLGLWKVVRPGVKVESVFAKRGGTNWIRRFAATSESLPLLPEAVILHDSYGNNLLRLLPPFFERLTFIHHDAADSDLAREEIAGAETVMIEVVERAAYFWMWRGFDKPAYVRLLETEKRAAE